MGPDFPDGIGAAALRILEARVRQALESLRESSSGRRPGGAARRWRPARSRRGLAARPRRRPGAPLVVSAPVIAVASMPRLSLLVLRFGI